MCAHYGQPASMALAFRQPSIDIFSIMSICYVGSVMVNKILQVNLSLKRTFFEYSTYSDLETRVRVHQCRQSIERI